MLSLLSLCLLGLTVVNSTVLYMPGQIRNQTELFDLSSINATATGTDHDAANNASSLGDPVDRHFRTVIDTNPDIRINGKSTYMNILKATIQLSYSEGTHAYAGETFSFRDYTNVKVQITREISSSTTLQYRYAIWGLFNTARYLTNNNIFTFSFVSLYWDGSGVPVLIGTIKIFPDPLPDIASSTKIPHLISIGQQAETLSNSSTLANFTSIEYKETDLATISNDGNFKVFLQFQGQILSIKEVFMTLFFGTLHIASFSSDQIVDDFVMTVWFSKTEFRYENYDGPRTSPPFFTYRVAARTLAYIPRYMFVQGKFGSVTFVVEIGGTPVGTGYIRKSSTASDKIQGN